MPLYTFEINGQLQPWLQREWLLTNGIGGFASSSVVGCNRRRYHGLLCAATTPPVGRSVLLSRIGEILIFQDQPDRMLELAVNQFGDRFHPRGEQYLKTFELDETVRWTYEAEGIKVVKELQLPWMKNVALLRYTVEPPPGRKVEFRLLPFVAMRDYHALRRGQEEFKLDAEHSSVGVSGGGLHLHLCSDPGAWVAKPDWWFGHTYAIEAERGLDFTEDLFNPGWFTFPVDSKMTIQFQASLTDQRLDWKGELVDRCRTIASYSSGAGKKLESPTLQALSRAANDFIVARKAPDGSDGSTIIAGYPWFADWGRDTMISLPGLLLTTGRFAQARQVLCVFAQYVSEGMIPNRFDDQTGKPEYNTVDASLWFVHAVFEYLRLSRDQQTFDGVLRPACEKIIEGYRAGTRYHIKMDEADGLISQGDATTQLTWMDAKQGDTAFTPRQGKPVEINALWHHALCLMGRKELAEKAAASFRRAFWISPFRGMADVVDGSPGADGNYPRRDVAIRPNQIFAVSLAHSPLTQDQQLAVVEVVRRELLTPMGLRTLARNLPGYRGRYQGGPFQRDSAYHNGTVWPWLIGAFLEAHLRVQNRSKAAVEHARQWLSPLIESMKTNCIGQIGEINDGDPPHRSVGCFAQAWSVAEALRLAAELEM
ncbi:MAG TPA: amylo-alpha-1,6-glucosidase [Tepidisphaeraceae bacterium]|nr:amylo-alpha-1,6-glucosidase [Tepidisphaeraceae bacterium]